MCTYIYIYICMYVYMKYERYLGSRRRHRILLPTTPALQPREGEGRSDRQVDIVIVGTEEGEAGEEEGGAGVARLLVFGVFMCVCV
jgi:hypothetical protein